MPGKTRAEARLRILRSDRNDALSRRLSDVRGLANTWTSPKSEKKRKAAFTVAKLRVLFRHLARWPEVKPYQPNEYADADRKETVEKTFRCSRPPPRGCRLVQGGER